MIVVTGRVHVAAENRERFVSIATEMCSRSREEDACSGYRVYADLEQPDRYVIVEEWADDEALQLHFGQPHTASFMGELPSLLASAPDAVFHTVESARKLDPESGLVPVD